MADGKKSFLMYCDLIHTIEKLSDENAGKLLKHLLRYVNDKNPIPENDYIDLVFEPIKQQLKRDLGDWEVKKSERSISGRMGNLKRWNADLHLKVELLEFTLEQAETIAINRKTSLSDKNIANVAVNDTVTVNVNDIPLKKETNVVDWDKLLSTFNSITGKKTRIVNDKTRKQILARLKEGYSKLDIQEAIENCFKDKYHIETNHDYLTLEFISRPDKMEKYSSIKEKNK